MPSKESWITLVEIVASIGLSSCNFEKSESRDDSKNVNVVASTTPSAVINNNDKPEYFCPGHLKWASNSQISAVMKMAVQKHFKEDGQFPHLLTKGGIPKVYQAGLHLVEPILQLNFQRGVRELIKNPLTKQELRYLPGYRKKIMDKVKQ